MVTLLGAEKVIVSVPIIPGVNNEAQEMRRISTVVKEAGIKMVRLLPYHGLGVQKYAKTGKKYEMEESLTVDSDNVQELKKIMEEAGLKCII